MSDPSMSERGYAFATKKSTLPVEHPMSKKECPFLNPMESMSGVMHHGVAMSPLIPSYQLLERDLATESMAFCFVLGIFEYFCFVLDIFE